MSKTIKLILIIFGVIVLLLVSAMIIVSTTVDPNAFKPKIADLVKKHTGRDLVVSGDFGLKIFPSIELTIGKASLGNVKGFGKNPFFSYVVHYELGSVRECNRSGRALPGRTGSQKRRSDRACGVLLTCEWSGNQKNV